MYDDAINDSLASLRANEEFEVLITKRKKASTPPYLIIGNGRTTKEYKDACVIDAFKVVGQLSAQQLEIFLYFRDVIVDNALYHRNAKMTNERPNEVEIPRTSGDTKAQEIKTLLRNNRNGARLQELAIIKRVSMGVYMVNPYLIIPHDNFAKVAKQWEEISC